MVNGKYYKLKEHITEIELFQVLNEANRRRWKSSIVTDLDNLNFREAEHDDLDLRDEYSEVQIRDNVYELVGFIVLNCIKIETIEVFDGTNTIIFFEDVVHFNGNADELREMMARLSLSPEFWIDTGEHPDGIMT